MIGLAREEEEDDEEEEETSMSDVSRSFVDGRVEDVLSWPPPNKQKLPEEQQEGKLK